MQPPSRQELYRQFIDFIRQDSQRERSLVNRRMLNVLIWCFLLPAFSALVILLLVRTQLLPARARMLADWVILGFPLAYSLYFFSAEVLRDTVMAFRQGGIATVLGQAAKDGQWREQVCQGLERAVHAMPADWTWLAASFRMDLESFRHRNRYLTGLAGAVFFLIFQGIDSISEITVPQRVWSGYAAMGWIESSLSGLSQMVGLVLFLVLLYLSGSQTYHSLRRYLNCAEMMTLPGRIKPPKAD